MAAPGRLPDEECDHQDAHGSTIIIGETPANDPVCLLCDRRFPKWPMVDVIEGGPLPADDAEKPA